MSLKVVVDEDLPRQAVRLLQEHGYEATSVIERGILVVGKTRNSGLK